MKLGLTGGIACGKSTVSAMLAERGAKIVDADQTAREVVLPGEAALEAIVAVFGQAVLNQDGTMNRSALGSIVFSDPARLSQLEAILHPAIRTRMWGRINVYEQEDPSQLIVADIPLLYETGQASLYDGIMVVYVPRLIQIERLMSRNSITAEQAEAAYCSADGYEEKRQLANYVIDNSGTLEQTALQVERFWHEQGLS